MIIGFTGTRSGMTAEQREEVTKLVMFYKDLHAKSSCIGLHGDCIGADADFDAICRADGLKTLCMPSNFVSTQAKTGATAIGEPKPPLARNREIVSSATVMIACPPNFEELKKGSGTWATIRYTKRANKPLYIVYPDGRVEGHNV